MGTPNHEHKCIWIKDPINGHEWEVCICGYSVDVTLMRGKHV